MAKYKTTYNSRLFSSHGKQHKIFGENVLLHSEEYDCFGAPLRTIRPTISLTVKITLYLYLNSSKNLTLVNVFIVYIV